MEQGNSLCQVSPNLICQSSDLRKRRQEVGGERRKEWGQQGGSYMYKGGGRGSRKIGGRREDGTSERERGAEGR